MTAYRVAVVAACPFPAPRGTPTRVLRSAEALARRGHDVHVATYHLGEDLPGDAPLHVHRIRPIAGYTRLVPGPTYRKLLQLDVRLASLLGQLLRTHRFDVVHAHHYEGLLIALAARRTRGRRLPILYDAHTLLAWELATYRMGIPPAVARRLGRWLDRVVPRRADAVAAVTERIRTILVGTGGVPLDRITVVPSGVEPEFFDVAPAVRHGPRAARTVIFTGNLAPYQGIALLLESFRLIRARRDDVRMRIVTDDPLESLASLVLAPDVRHAIDIERTDRTGVVRALAAADVAIHPRVHSDGLPQKLLNYMAAGKPIVSFRGSAGALDHGVTGWLVPDGDAAALAEGVLRCLDDPTWAARLGEQARRVARERYSWDHSAAMIEGMYDRLMERR